MYDHRFMSATEKKFEQIGSLTALVLLVTGCYVVLKPFMVAVAWAIIVCFCTWPIYSLLERLLGGRRNSAASLMSFLIFAVIIVPLVLLGFYLADDIGSAINAVRHVLTEGRPPPPSWLLGIPLVGNWFTEMWLQLPQDGGTLLTLLKDFLITSKGWLVARGSNFGHGLAQLFLSVFVSFFIYRDGAYLVKKLSAGMDRLVGGQTQHLLRVIGGTIKGVVYGVLGTALAQGFLAGLGFWMAGVHVPFILGLLTFFFSMVPMGPPLIWVPAAIWLFYQESTLWGVALALWGFFVISGVDNVLKPYLISRGSRMPFILVFLGVLGGILWFGVIGVFLGPTLLAVGYTLVKEWIEKSAVKNA